MNIQNTINSKIFKLKVIIITFLLIYPFTFGFSQWTQINTLANLGTYPSVSVVDQSVYFIAGGNSGAPVLYRTTNNGANFTTIPTTGITLEFFCVYAKDANTIYVGDGGVGGGAGGNAHVYKTTNAGTNWTTILSTGGTAGFFNGVMFSKSNPQFGIAQSDPPTTGGAYYLAKTTNGGTNWTVTNPPSTGSASSQNSVFCIDANFYGFGLNSNPARIYFTTNGGTNWILKTLTGAGGATGFVSSISFSSDKLNGIGASDNTSNTISRTTDGGNTWFSQTTPCTITGYANVDWVLGTNTVYLLVSNNTATQSYKSEDNGATWTSYTFPGTANHSWHMDLAYSGGNANLVSSASNGAISMINESPMPVKLESFTSGVQGRNVNLRWATTFEENNYGFNIERIVIGQTNAVWTNVGFVNGNGNSNRVTNYNFSDSKLNTGKYQYRLKQVDFNGNFEYFTLNTTIEIGLPGKFNLSQNYPNPFNPVTKIDYELPYNSNVSIILYDMTGREVKTLVNTSQIAGYYTIQLNSDNLSSGTYFYRLIANSNGNNTVITKKLNIVK